MHVVTAGHVDTATDVCASALHVILNQSKESTFQGREPDMSLDFLA